MEVNSPMPFAFNVLSLTPNTCAIGVYILYLPLHLGELSNKFDCFIARVQHKVSTKVQMWLEHVADAEIFANVNVP